MGKRERERDSSGVSISLTGHGHLTCLVTQRTHTGEVLLYPINMTCYYITGSLVASGVHTKLSYKR